MMTECSEAIRRVATAINQLDGIYYLLGKRSGINENVLAILSVMSNGEPHSQKEISDKYLIPRTTINSIIKSMLAEGYLSFCPGRQRKEKLLQLTPQGKAYAAAIRAEINLVETNAMTATLAVYPPDFIDALEDYSERMFRELNALPAK